MLIKTHRDNLKVGDKFHSTFKPKTEYEVLSIFTRKSEKFLFCIYLANDTPIAFKLSDMYPEFNVVVDTVLCEAKNLIVGDKIVENDVTYEISKIKIVSSAIKSLKLCLILITNESITQHFTLTQNALVEIIPNATTDKKRTFYEKEALA